MNPRILRDKNRVLTRCERDGWLFPRTSADTTHSARISNIVASLEGKRRQMVERLLERTLSNYLDKDNEVKRIER